MGLTGVYIATEDALGEAVAERLVSDENHGLTILVKLGLKGNGYLRVRLRQFAQMAHSHPFLLFTDLDHIECPKTLIDDWCRNDLLPANMLFRIAVRETEAWLLADREGFAEFSGVPSRRIPEKPETLDDPKEAMLDLVRRYGKRVIKADILPGRDSSAKVGLAYNQALCAFVQGLWSPVRASQASDSLKRARQRLHELRLSL